MKFRPWHLALITVVAVVAIAFVAVGGDQPGSLKRDGSSITTTVSRTEPDATATFDIVLLEGGDAEHESAHIFDSLRFDAISSVTLNTETLQLTVAYDSKAISEDGIRQALAQAGYIKRTAADAVAAGLSADGASQSITIVPGEGLEPGFISAKAGVPLAITFNGVGTSHLTSISIPALNITQDLTTAGATITIADPAPGQYDLVCAEGVADGVLVVE